MIRFRNTCFLDLDKNCYGVMMEKAFLEQVQEKMGREDLETASVDNEMLAHARDSGVKRSFLFSFKDCKHSSIFVY